MLQPLFDRMVAGLRAQNWKKSTQSPTSKTCAYRNPNGLKCAVGHILDDEDYDPAMEEIEVHYLPKHVLEKILGDPDPSERQYEFLNACQLAHDYATLQDPMETRLRRVATQYNLEFPE